MATDYNHPLPVMTKGDANEKTQSKIVDFTTPTQGMEVDSDKNAHVEVHGNKPAGSDVVLTLSETGRVNPDGDYDGTNNTKPGSIGVVAHDRGATIDETSQNKRVTAVAGGSNSVCMDVAISDKSGNPFSMANPLPVVEAEDPGAEKHDFKADEDVAKDATVNHDYPVADTKVFKLYKVLCSMRGQGKFVLKIGDGADPEVFTTKAVVYSDVANKNPVIDFGKVGLAITGTTNTTTIRVAKTNIDNDTTDMYTTIVGIES